MVNERRICARCAVATILLCLAATAAAESYVVVEPSVLKPGDGSHASVMVTASGPPSRSLKFQVEFREEGLAAGKTGVFLPVRIYTGASELPVVSFELMGPFNQRGVYNIEVYWAERPGEANTPWNYWCAAQVVRESYSLLDVWLEGFLRLIGRGNNDWVFESWGGPEADLSHYVAGPFVKTPATSAIWLAPMPRSKHAPVLDKELHIGVSGATHPAWSPDGKLLACSVWREGNRSSKGRWSIAIYRFQVSGSLFPIWIDPEAHEGNDFNPVWSPDGEELAFLRVYEERGTSSVRRLLLARNGRPTREVILAGLYHINQLFSWTSAGGLLLEMGRSLQKGKMAPGTIGEDRDAAWRSKQPGTPFTNVWSVRLPDDETPRLVPLAVPYIYRQFTFDEAFLRARSPTQSWIVWERNGGQFLVALDQEEWWLLLGSDDNWSYHWPAISTVLYEGRHWIAVASSDRPSR